MLCSGLPPAPTSVLPVSHLYTPWTMGAFFFLSLFHKFSYFVARRMFGTVQDTSQGAVNYTLANIRHPRSRIRAGQYVEQHFLMHVQQEVSWVARRSADRWGKNPKPLRKPSTVWGEAGGEWDGSPAKQEEHVIWAGELTAAERSAVLSFWP